jgi:hypothetical protein
MVTIIYIIASVLVWLEVFLFAKFNLGISSNSVLATSLVTGVVIAVFFGLNTFRLAIKPNMAILAVVLLLNIASLFAIDYFIADFTINSVALGVVLGLCIAAIFLGALVARKTILGSRTQL